ncbi:MAG: hypothetical protein P4M14_07820 [Gammaproteobacteria bacterium]|nr:hypothetical protein [Gammaproteobacteria bacterium]
MRLLATYEITGKIEGKLAAKMLDEKLYYQFFEDRKEVLFNTREEGNPVENPIIRLAYIILKEHPELMNKTGHVPRGT